MPACSRILAVWSLCRWACSLRNNPLSSVRGISITNEFAGGGQFLRSGCLIVPASSQPPVIIAAESVQPVLSLVALQPRDRFLTTPGIDFYKLGIDFYPPVHPRLPLCIATCRTVICHTRRLHFHFSATSGVHSTPPEPHARLDSASAGSSENARCESARADAPFHGPRHTPAGFSAS